MSRAENTKRCAQPYSWHLGNINGFMTSDAVIRKHPRILALNSQLILLMLYDVRGWSLEPMRLDSSFLYQQSLYGIWSWNISNKYWTEVNWVCVLARFDASGTLQAWISGWIFIAKCTLTTFLSTRGPLVHLCIQVCSLYSITPILIPNWTFLNSTVLIRLTAKLVFGFFGKHFEHNEVKNLGWPIEFQMCIGFS
jgi:hypothetical protein